MSWRVLPHAIKLLTACVIGLLASLVALAPPAAAEGTVTVQVVGQGRVTGSGIACTNSGGPDCSEFYADSVEQICIPDVKPPCRDIRTAPTVDLAAEPGINGYALAGWTGCDSNPSPTTCRLTVSGPATVRADYVDVQAPYTPSLWVSSRRVRDDVVVRAMVADNSGQVARVEFRAGGVLVSTDTSAPFEAVVDTTTRPEGPLELTAAAFDARGNRSSTGAASVTVDRTAPTVDVTGGPDADTLRAGTVPAWTFSVAQPPSGDAHTVSCSIVRSDAVPAAGDWEACTAPGAHSADGLVDDGTYTFRVAARDGAGNRTEVARTFSIDGTAPTTRITKGPRKVVKTRTRRSEARFAFAANEPGATYQCSLDGGRFRACTARPVFRVKQGRHVLRVRALDRVGNVDTTPATWRWRVARRG